MSILPIASLLLGSAFLLFAGGVTALLLPLKGGMEGFSSISLGLIGTGWAIGHVVGCLLAPKLVRRVGHIRSFSVVAACAAISVLATSLFTTPFAWIPLRALTGFSFVGAAMIVESWLTERTEPQARGRVFGLYTMTNLGASTMGQMSLILSGGDSDLFFTIAAIFFALAVIPSAVSSTEQPRPLVQSSLDLKALWRNSPIAVVAVLLTGISNGAFGTLSAVFAADIGLQLSYIALFSSIPVLAGAVLQVPVGMISDKMDRRYALLAISAVAVAVEITFVQLKPASAPLALALGAAFGATIFAMYPVILAHANDHAPREKALQTSSGLLLLYGAGSVLGPMIAGFAMTEAGPYALFTVTACAHSILIGFTILRIARRAPVEQRLKRWFVPTGNIRHATPQTLAMREDSIAAHESEKDAA